MPFMWIFVYLCYPFSNENYGCIATPFIAGKIAHVPHSQALFRRMCKQISLCQKSDSIIRIAVVCGNPENGALRDSVADVLRELFNDPRKTCTWQWSRNWLALGKNFASPFNRPSIFINTNPDSPHHDYINGWVQCNRVAASKAFRLHIVYKNHSPETISTFSCDTNCTQQQTLSDDGNWHSLFWPMNNDSAMITIDGRESPEIGNISVEPATGFSIWTFRLPEKISAASLLHFRQQIDLVPPQLVIVVGQKNDAAFANSFFICKKIFSNTPLLTFSIHPDTQLAQTSFAHGCAYLCGENFSNPNFWKLALQHDIPRCFP